MSTESPRPRRITRSGKVGVPDGVPQAPAGSRPPTAPARPRLHRTVRMRAKRKRSRCATNLPNADNEAETDARRATRAPRVVRPTVPAPGSMLTQRSGTAPSPAASQVTWKELRSEHHPCLTDGEARDTSAPVRADTPKTFGGTGGPRHGPRLRGTRRRTSDASLQVLALPRPSLARRSRQRKRGLSVPWLRRRARTSHRLVPPCWPAGAPSPPPPDEARHRPVRPRLQADTRGIRRTTASPRRRPSLSGPTDLLASRDDAVPDLADGEVLRPCGAPDSAERRAERRHGSGASARRRAP